MLSAVRPSATDLAHSAAARRFVLLALCLAGVALARDYMRVPSPADVYGELFTRVQMQSVFGDSKTFPDAVPLQSPSGILGAYARQRADPTFDLGRFVRANFTPPAQSADAYRSDPHGSVCAHIDALWSVLTRGPDVAVAYSSLLPLPQRYVVPGGRFREIYYWDSYFTMIGLEASGRHDLVRDMVHDFAFLIDRYGHVPNGSRSYYLSRSQPPFFASMVELLAKREGGAAFREFLPQLEEEYAYWMQGGATLGRGEARGHVVRLQDGSLLNRYWDERATPRDESYREDVHTAMASGREPTEVYRNLRAAAESGWDFSSRWFADARTLGAIRTVDLVPVDLNSLLYQLESTLAHAYGLTGAAAKASQAQQEARERKRAMQRLLWDETAGIFADYAWRERRVSGAVTAAALYPLYFGIADAAQAARTAQVVRTRLLESYGLATTTVTSGQQWDAPNGWAPLQWIAIEGLADYGQSELAGSIAQRWMEQVVAVYRGTGRLLEKYDVTGRAQAGGGEYSLQDGFGWTNGVLRQLLNIYPNGACR
jgi:alpha,alpha-trehalase